MPRLLFRSECGVTIDNAIKLARQPWSTEAARRLADEVERLRKDLDRQHELLNDCHTSFDTLAREFN